MLGCSASLRSMKAENSTASQAAADRYGIRDGKNMRSASMRRNEALCISASDKKEEKTRNRKMAAVGEMTRWQHEQVKDDGCVRYSELVWQNGGHFTDVEKRIAHGFAWLIDHAQG